MSLYLISGLQANSLCSTSAHGFPDSLSGSEHEVG